MKVESIGSFISVNLLCKSRESNMRRKSLENESSVEMCEQNEEYKTIQMSGQGGGWEQKSQLFSDDRGTLDN